MKIYPHEGETLKLKLREKGLNMIFIARKPGISRQTLYNHLHREKLDNNFYISVKETFNISLTNIAIKDDAIIPEYNKIDHHKSSKVRDYDIWQLQAQIKAIIHVTAKLMAKSSGREILEL